MKLLLVDDDVFLRDMYALKFTGCGYIVDVADSPARALSMLREKADYDVVLLDMIMPGMSGVELMQTIRAEFPDSSTKYIFLTNQGQAEDITEAKASGAIGYIIKAESIPSEVVKKVEDLIKK